MSTRTPPQVSSAQVFGALLSRDLRVAKREIVSFMLRSALQPLLFTIVFGYLLPKMGFVSRGYTAAILPGVLGVTLALSSLQAVALPMVVDFGWSREIEDRLLAPIPIELVAIEKVVAGILQGVVAALFVLPVARLIMGPIPGLSIAHLGIVLAVTLLGSASFSALGLLMGTAFAPQNIGLMFSLIVAPMIMFGCAYYPWRSLAVAPVMQVAVLLNPLVYVSEGLRAALTPSLPHMPLPIVLAAMATLTFAFGLLGLRSFVRRAVA